MRPNCRVGLTVAGSDGNWFVSGWNLPTYLGKYGGSAREAVADPPTCYAGDPISTFSARYLADRWTIETTPLNGQRFLVAVRVRDPSTPPIRILVNWRSLLKH